MEAVSINVKILMVATFVNAVMGFSWMAMGKLVQVNVKLKISRNSDYNYYYRIEHSGDWFSGKTNELYQTLINN